MKIRTIKLITETIKKIIISHRIIIKVAFIERNKIKKDNFFLKLKNKKIRVKGLKKNSQQ